MGLGKGREKQERLSGAGERLGLRLQPIPEVQSAYLHTAFAVKNAARVAGTQGAQVGPYACGMRT